MIDCEKVVSASARSRDPQSLRRRKWTSAEASDFGCLTGVISAASVLVVVLAVFGQIELLIGVIITVSAAVAWWALPSHELSQDSATRFRELRRLVRLRKQHNEDSEGSGSLSPVVVFGIAAAVGAFCTSNLTSAWKQFCAMDLPVAKGKITRHELVDVDLSSKLEVEYDYTVAGRLYHGKRLRFVYRAYRVGTDAAKKLAATWRLGNNASVFYQPDRPTDAVLDNTFCKGDQLQVGLNAIALILSLLVMSGACYLQLRSREIEMGVEYSQGAFIVPLCNIPLCGTFATLIAIGSLMLTFTALLAGQVAMGDTEIPWLVNTIDCLYIVTAVLFFGAGTVCAIERVSFGIAGRKLVVDTCRQTISWSPETIGETASINARHLQSLRVVSNREDCFRLARTFSVVATYADHSGTLHSKVIQRSYERRYAVAIASAIKGFIAAEIPAVAATEERLVESRHAGLKRKFQYRI